MRNPQSAIRLALTTGEPAGIGPEIAVAALDALPAGVECVLIGDRSLFAHARLPGSGSIEHVALGVPIVPGRLDVRNARYVLAMLDRAIAGALSGEFDAVVTAPVQKSVLNDAGIRFTGHTEYLAEKTGTRQVVMMLVGGEAAHPLRVALATTHLPLAQVPRAITIDGLVATIEVLHADLVAKFGIASPRIGVCGLNPHAGEGGHLGREEIEVIAPALERLRARGIALDGPLPADTVFVPANACRYDAIVAMYHDQGLAPLKYASFGHGVNVTLGLPFVRTSVDHGTALDLAGTGRADAGSLRAALALAVELAQRRAGTERGRA
ncbi:MAG: 4-hydroxythreonine-4-phosphate dehydrogenase PdxA [Burkholderiaceae bacterium]|nr:4-hydroxythreonine-4-phosphate dehydrogenase PdxA [Burkholderiaceae bacterium]